MEYLIEPKNEVIDTPDDESNTTTMVTPHDDHIQLIFMPAGVFVVRREDIIKLRLLHRIVGEYVGTCQMVARRDRKSPPLRLRYEEARLLLEKNLAKLTKPRFDLIHDDEKIRVQEIFDRRLHEYMSQKKRMLTAKYTKGRKPPKEEFNDKNRRTVIPVEALAFVGDEVTLDEFRSQSGCPRKDLLADVFRDLWKQQYYAASGSNYGVDLTAYVGDPADNHSFGCIKCVDDKTKISARDIIRDCRLCRSVRKNFVLACPREDEVQYMTLTWLA